MTEQKKRLPWRCKNQQQAKDKQEIYILSPLIRGGYKAGII